jgi:hypothetical protein
MVMLMTFNGITIQYSNALSSNSNLNGNTGYHGNIKSISYHPLYLILPPPKAGGGGSIAFADNISVANRYFYSL